MTEEEKLLQQGDPNNPTFQEIKTLEDYQKRFDEDYKVRFKSDFESGIKDRLTRQTEKHKQELLEKDKALLEKYGLENYDLLDELVNNGKGYQAIASEKETLSAKLEELSTEKMSVEQKYQELNEKYLLTINNVDDKQVSDLKAFFKGQDREITDENLKEFLAKHPDFVKKTISVKIGNGDEKGRNPDDLTAYDAFKSKMNKKLKIN